MNKRATYIFGSFFFSGSAPRARGTIGTFIPALMILGVEHLWAPVWWWTLVAAVIVFVFGVYVGNFADEQFEKDPGWFVLDEVAGMLLAVCGQIALNNDEPWLVVLVAFIAFRFFDIVKPPPVRQVERGLGRGMGIMMDDIVAAVIAWGVTYGVLQVL